MSSKQTSVSPPAGSDARLNALSSLTGRTTEANLSRIYSCTSVSPAREPMFFSLALTFVFPPCPMTGEERRGADNSHSV